MEDSCTVFVFHDAEHARIFNREVGASFDESIGMAVDFETLPFSVNPPPGTEPRDDETVGRFYHYPVEYAAILRGIDFLLRDDGIDVLNLSLGPSGFEFDPDDPLQVATYYVYRTGVPVVVAAGNDGPDDGTLQPLAQAPWVITVGATDPRRELLETSSRGRRNGPFPTVVTFGYPPVTYIGEGIPEFPPGTSFAAPQVARIAILVSKAMELLVGNWNDAGTSSWTDESRPIRLSKFGIADTGTDSRASEPLPAAVASAVAAHKDHLTFVRTEHEYRWLAAVQDRIEGRISPLMNVGPELVKEALKAIAEPLPGRERHEAGFGFVSRPLAYGFLATLTPSRLVRLFFPDRREEFADTELTQLDDALGPLWSGAFVNLLQECFYFGSLLRVAKVVR
jgi:hypothetical protein